MDQNKIRKRRMKIKFSIAVILIGILLKHIFSLFGFGRLYVHSIGTALSKEMTDGLYWGILFCALFVYVVVLNRRRTWWQAFHVAVVPCGVFLLIRFPVSFMRFIIYAITYYVLSFLYDICQNIYLWYRKKPFKGIGKIVSDSVNGIMWGLGIIAFLYFGSVISERVYLPIEIKISGLSSNPVTYSTDIGMAQEADIGEMWENNKDDLIKLSNGRYPRLTFQEKIDAFQVILDIEMAYLGCPPVQLASEKMEDSLLAGYYNGTQRLVVINSDIIDSSAEQAIGVLLHEAWHVYQEALCESLSVADFPEEYKKLMFYRNVGQWQYEMEHYVSGMNATDLQGYLSYADQELERSAEEYSDEWAPLYIAYINALESKIRYGRE